MKKLFFGIFSVLIISITSQLAVAKEISVTYVAGHPPVFRWVKHVNQTFIPAVNKSLEGSGHSIKWSEQYGGSLAKVGDELEAVEEGLADGMVSGVTRNYPETLKPALEIIGLQKNIPFHQIIQTTKANHFYNNLWKVTLKSLKNLNAV